MNKNIVLKNIIFRNLFYLIFLYILMFSNIFPKNINKWAILLDYDSTRNENIENNLKNYDMLILDPDSHPNLNKIKKNNKDILFIAYISIGEAESYRSYWDEIKNDRKLIISENENWKENYFVNVSNEKWQNIILNKVIPNIILKGFKGLFLDTIDTVDYLNHKYPGQYPNAKNDMTKLIKMIKQKYPDLELISNNGLTILPEIYNELFGMLFESLFGTYKFENSYIKYILADKKESNIKLNHLLSLKKYNQNKPIFIIDYADIKNKEYVKYLSKKIKKYKFNPYIAERELNNIYDIKG
jgi:polysaccharide biosynthesis protein PelA